MCSKPWLHECWFFPYMHKAEMSQWKQMAGSSCSTTKGHFSLAIGDRRLNALCMQQRIPAWNELICISSVLSVSYKSIWSESSNWSRLLSFLKSPWFSYSGQAKWLTTNWTVAIQMPILTHGKIVSLAKAWVKLCTSRAGRSEMISLQKAGVKPW